MKIKLFSCLKT